MKLAFYTPHVCLRGTTVAIYDYAKFNQDILGNESILIYDESDPRNDESTILKFKESSIKTISLKSRKNMKDIDDCLKFENVDAVYTIKCGSPKDGIISNVTKSLIHVTGMSAPENKHGNVWAYVSYFLKEACAKNENIPVVPHMVHLPEIEDDFRKIFGIPKNALVFGRTGGTDTWNISYANRVINEVLNKRNDVYFIFQNTQIPFKHERLINIPTSSDLIFKTKFINTCDAMIHARLEGESFGLACAEFSLRNKPIITWNGSSERSHINILGNKAHLYNNDLEMLDCMIDFERKFDDYNCYKEYYPKNVMNIFNEIFLKE